MHTKRYKTILSPKNGLNLYRGCSHGCIYCDSRSVCYQMDHGFEDIEVKEDAIAILRQQLQKKRQACMISTGAMTDPYLHLEEKLRLTQQSLELVEELGFGVALLTKSERVLADIDLLQRINNKTKAVVQVTLTTSEDRLAQKIEPRVSVTSQRIRVLAECQKRGIPTVVWLGPLLPFLTDTEENLRALLVACHETGVKGIINFGFGVTLREGNREYFYQQLDRLFPGVKQRYIQYFGNRYECSSPNNQQLMQVYHQLCEAYGIMHHNEAVFRYLQTFEPENQQLSLF